MPPVDKVGLELVLALMFTQVKLGMTQRQINVFV